MKQDTWRERLEAEIIAQGRSLRSVSEKAGLGANYVYSILREGKEPSIERLLEICNVLDVSMSKILKGIEITPAEEEYLELLQSAPEELRQNVLGILRSVAKK